MDDNGNAIVSENAGHSHTIDSGALRNIMFNHMMSKYQYEHAFTEEERQMLAKSGEAMVDGTFPICEINDLKNAIQYFASVNVQNKKEDVAKHIVKRADALGLTYLLPHKGPLAELISKQAAESGGGQQENETMPKTIDAADKEAVEKQFDELTTSLSDTKEELKKAIAYGELTDDQKIHYGSLNDADKESFLSKSLEERQQDLDNAKAENAVVYKSLDGDEYYKNDDPRLIAMAKRADIDRDWETKLSLSASFKEP